MTQIFNFKERRADQVLDSWLEKSSPYNRDRDNPDSSYKIPPFPQSLQDNCNCSEEEKESLRPLIDFILELHETTARIGIPGIYDEYEPHDIPDLFLKHALNLTLDGFRASSLERLLSFKIQKARARGVALLRRMIIRDGCLSLLKGNTPLEARLHLLSLLHNVCG